MKDRWVNAVVEFTIALDVSPDAHDEEKRVAVMDCFEEHFAEAAGEHVATMRAETVEDGEPVEVDPAVRLAALRKGLQGEVTEASESYRAHEEMLTKARADEDGVGASVHSAAAQAFKETASRLSALLDSSGGEKP